MDNDHRSSSNAGAAAGCIIVGAVFMLGFLGGIGLVLLVQALT